MPSRRNQTFGPGTRNRHRTDTAGYRRDGACHLHGVGEGDVADNSSFSALPGYTVDPYVDDGCPRLYSIATNHFRATDGGDKQIGATADRGKIVRLRMGNGHRRIFCEQKLRHRLPDDVRATDHHGLKACKGFVHGILARITQPIGVHGTSADRPLASRPALTG